MREADILKSILDYLAAEGILAFRLNSALTVAEYKGKKRAFRSGVLGMADIIAFPTKTARYLGERTGEDFATLTHIVPTWLECKAPKGKQSELQKSFQAQVEAHGHKYVLAYSLDDVIQALQA